ncbi:hypothetical protein AB672_03730 [Xylella taiwanensis]|nr:hypothetical protein AB672_03730 [Xylella taiwanensis]
MVCVVSSVRMVCRVQCQLDARQATHALENAGVACLVFAVKSLDETMCILLYVCMADRGLEAV